MQPPGACQVTVPLPMPLPPGSLLLSAMTMLVGRKLVVGYALTIMRYNLHHVLVYALLNTQADAITDLTVRSSGGVSLDRHSHAQCSQTMFGTCHGNSQRCCPSAQCLTCRPVSTYKLNVFLRCAAKNGDRVLRKHTIWLY